MPYAPLNPYQLMTLMNADPTAYQKLMQQYMVSNYQTPQQAFQSAEDALPPELQWKFADEYAQSAKNMFERNTMKPGLAQAKSDAYQYGGTKNNSFQANRVKGMNAQYSQQAQDVYNQNKLQGLQQIAAMRGASYNNPMYSDAGQDFNNAFAMPLQVQKSVQGTFAPASAGTFGNSNAPSSPVTSATDAAGGLGMLLKGMQQPQQKQYGNPLSGALGALGGGASKVLNWM